MTKWKKIWLFVFSQLKQISDGGIIVFFGKVRKFVRLFWLNLFAPLAVHFKIDWQLAYWFMGRKKFMGLKRIRSQTNPDRKMIKIKTEEVIRYFLHIFEREPDLANMDMWLEAQQILEGLYHFQGNISRWNDVCQTAVGVREKILKKYQLDRLGIEFIPRRLAMGNIGVYEHLEAYLKTKKMGLISSREQILIVDPQTPVNNSDYLDYWKQHITVISEPSMIRVLEPLEKCLTIPLTSYISLQGKVYKSFMALGEVRSRWIEEGRAPLLTISDEDYVRGWNALKSFGMRKDDWFVCLHVREGGWNDLNSATEDFRNADINTYHLAIKAITDAGGWVIRMGDPGMNPLPSMSRVVDYAHSDAKSSWMDVFLCAQCRFFIGTSSGLSTVAMAFGVPVVGTNILPACGTYYSPSIDLFIPRICRHNGENRLLNFSELYSPPIGISVSQHDYARANVEILENTDEEIEDVVKEMVQRCKGLSAYSQEDEDLQKRFKAMTLDCSKLYGDEHVAVNARIGRKFLRKYEGLLISYANV